VKKKKANGSTNGHGSTNGLGSNQEFLLAKRSELLSGFRSKLDILAGPGPTALEDLAPVFHDQFIALRINRLDYVQLKLIDAALNRMDSQDYGMCEDCGDPIPSRRLEAIPWATRCIACQERSSLARDSPQPAGMVVPMGAKRAKRPART
jgi:DnaK suppressor protein